MTKQVFRAYHRTRHLCVSPKKPKSVVCEVFEGKIKSSHRFAETPDPLRIVETTQT